MPKVDAEIASEIVRKIADSILEENGVLNAELMELPKPFRAVRSIQALGKGRTPGRINKETAFINKDGLLIIHYWSKLGHLINEAWDHIKPTQPHYLELCYKHGLKQAGDRHEIALEWANGSWRKVA